jgi:hypothetical protein
MSVYKKLQTVAVELQKTEIKKSGNNKFAGFKYFELGDFLPTVNELFLKNNLAGYCSFNKELATLTIVDTESGDKIEVTSPMVDISMKGANEIQNLGAVETYSRRYLYLAALGIVENDVVDSKPLDNEVVERVESLVPRREHVGGKISAKQLAFIQSLATPEDIKSILDKFGIDQLADLKIGVASAVIKQLQNKNS